MMMVQIKYKAHIGLHSVTSSSVFRIEKCKNAVSVFLMTVL